MIEAIQQGLKEDGYEVSIAKLCRWFGVPRRTFYYKPIKKAIPKLQERLVSPIKQLIEENRIALESLLLAQNEIAANKLILPFGMYKTHTTFHYLQFMKKNENLPKIKKFRNWLEKELKESFNYFSQFPVNEKKF